MGINVTTFKKDLELFEDAMIEEVVEAKRLLAGKTVELLAEKSPVLTGTYIYNHKVAIGGVADPSFVMLPRTPGDTNPAARAAKKAMLGKEMVLREKLGIQGKIKHAAGIVTIDNPVPHADDVEFGISRQYAPNGVYRVAAAHLETIEDSIVAAIPEKVL